MQHATRHYVTLDAMRGIAALNVTFLHARAMLLGGGEDHLGLALSVDFFFVLSGFVVAHAYGGKLRGGMGVGDYLLRRVIRLYPLAIIGTTLGLLAALIAGFGAPLANYAFNVLALPSPFTGGTGAFPINPPLWSLFIELILSVLFLGLFRLPVGGLVVVAGVSLALFAISYLTVGAYPMIGRNPWSLIGVLARGIGPFACGMIIQRFAHAPGLKRVFWPLAGLTLLILAAPIPMTMPPALPAVYLLFPLVILAGAQVDGFPLGRFLGEISYPLYILHWPILKLAELTIGPGMLAMVGGCTASVVLSWLVGRHIDAPVRTILTRFWRGRSLREA